MTQPFSGGALQPLFTASHRLHLGLHLDRVGDAAVVADALEKPGHVVVEVALVLDVAVPAVAGLGKRREDGGDVELAARPAHRDVLDRIDLDVLEVDVVDAIGILLDELDGVKASAALVADVEADADALVAVADALDGRLGSREEIRDVRSVVVDRVHHVVLLDETVDDVEHLVGLDARLLAVDLAILERHANDDANAELLRLLEALARDFLGVSVDRPDAHWNDVGLRELGLERICLLLRAVELQVEVLDAERMKVKFLHRRNRLVNVLLVEREPGDADLERNCGESSKRGHRDNGKQYLLHKFPFNFKLQTNMTYAIGLRNFL